MAGNLVRGLIFAFFADGHLSTKVELSTLNCKTLRTICEICTPKNFQLYRIIMPQAHNIIITTFSLAFHSISVTAVWRLEIYTSKLLLSSFNRQGKFCVIHTALPGRVVVLIQAQQISFL